MIIVAGTFTIDPSEIDRIRDPGVAMMEATRAEQGCIEYRFSVGIDDPSVVQVFEIWETQEHLEAHFVAPHMAEWRQALKGVTVTGRNLVTYDATATGTL